MNWVVNVDTDNEKSAILEFSQQYPWKPSYPVPLVKRFLTKLVSSNNLIFDIHDKNGRLASAVLLDKVNNPTNDACLEILGICPEADLGTVIRQLISLCKDQAPNSRTGFQITIADTSILTDNFFGAMGLKYYYSNYEMDNPAVTTIPIARSHYIQSAQKSDADSVYKVLCESFSKSPDVSIPEPTAWYPAFLKSQRSRYYLWREQDQIIGFTNVFERIFEYYFRLPSL